MHHVPSVHGQAMGLVRDPVRNQLWLYSKTALFQVRVDREDRDVWRLYLQQAKAGDGREFEFAFQHAKNAEQQDRIKNIKPRTDDDLMDDAVQQERLRVRDEAAAKKKAEAVKLKLNPANPEDLKQKSYKDVVFSSPYCNHRFFVHSCRVTANPHAIAYYVLARPADDPRLYTFK